MEQQMLWIVILFNPMVFACDEVIPNSDECSYRGDYRCGTCDCYSPYSGSSCEIDLNFDLESEGSDEMCKESAGALSVCSGRGMCHSGFCECDQRDNPDEVISGAFCECTNFICDRYNGVLCGGPDHGECDCNMCNCKPGWRGPSCSCSEAYDKCTNPVTGSTCSGHGDCVCNQCQCNRPYAGQWCHECPTCPSACEILKDCTFCQAFGGHSCSLSYDHYTRDCHFNVEMVGSLEDRQLCQFFDDEDCLYEFTYGYDTQGHLRVKVQMTRQCPPPRSHIPDPGKGSIAQPVDEVDQCLIVLPQEPKEVYSCADLSEDLAGKCKCYDCEGHISLHCSVCQECDLNIFKSTDFKVDIELELKQTCQHSLNLWDKFGRNEENIKYLKICVQNDIGLTYPLEKFVNLEGLAYQDCQKVSFSICQMRISSEERLPKMGPTRGLETSRRIRRSGYGMFPHQEDVPNLVQLNLVFVNTTLRQETLPYGRLRELFIHSDGGLVVEPNAFVRLIQLQVLTVKSHQEEFKRDSFRLTTKTLKQLTIQDMHVHSIAPDAIILDHSGEDGDSRTSSDKLTVAITLNPEYYDHIPMCPFRPLVDLGYVDMIWLSELKCRSCGGIWYWEMTPSEHSHLTASCYDAVSMTTIVLTDYTHQHQKMCHFLTDYNATCA